MYDVVTVIQYKRPLSISSPICITLFDKIPLCWTAQTAMRYLIKVIYYQIYINYLPNTNLMSDLIYLIHTGINFHSQTPLNNRNNITLV